MKNPNPVIIYFTKSAQELAAQISQMQGGILMDFGQMQPNAGLELQKLFLAKTPIIGVCATGILVRLLSPVLGDKNSEPAVISVSPDGQFVIPVLGGHRGANKLARELAGQLNSLAVITTASEGRYSFALDEPPSGYVLANVAPAKSAMADLLNGESLSVQGDHSWLSKGGYPISKDGTIPINVSENTQNFDQLVYHPKTLIAGVGCARATQSNEIIALVEATFARANLSVKSLAALISIDIKSDETGLHQAATHFGVPIKFVPADELAVLACKVPNPSKIVEAETGTPSVAEAAALMAGELIVQKQKTANATCAIGKSALPIEIENFGNAAGQLHIVGIGPGEKIQRTGSSSSALEQSTDWVGYGLYLDLIGDLHQDQHQHVYGLGEEEPRVRFAMELAARGKTVALVCSGDAQIYAMAALVYELLDATGERELSDGARRIGIESHPGISALQMASARVGALLGHDFCTISLSDLLTPRADIERRLLAAATGDFVTAFYNPRSKRRTDLIEIAKQLFLQHRPKDTPVIIASNLGRQGEKVRIVTLEDFDPEEIDMLTIVLFGASNSKSFVRGSGQQVAFTPRGYANKKGNPQ